MSYASTKPITRLVLLAAAILLASPVFAHTGHDHASGWTAGIVHPLAGVDHLLAMLAVGIWAAQHPQSVRWLLPVLFPAVMAAGALMGMRAIPLIGVEPGIAGSVAVLGLLIAFAVRMPLWGSAIVVSLFALLHGFAHGAELPVGAAPLWYGAGFVVSTLALHLVGLTIGATAARTAAGAALRMVGGAIAVIGAYLLAGFA
jgi:urease accessory protein